MNKRYFQIKTASFMLYKLITCNLYSNCGYLSVLGFFVFKIGSTIPDRLHMTYIFKFLRKLNKNLIKEHHAFRRLIKHFAAPSLLSGNSLKRQTTLNLKFYVIMRKKNFALNTVHVIIERHCVRDIDATDN